MTVAEESALADLGYHWGSAYAIGLRNGIWTAHSYERPADVLTAESPDELRTLIQRDYRGRPYESASL
jgi:hypothetical protein